MHHNILFFLVQFVIFCNQNNFIQTRGLKGVNVRPARSNEYPSVVCIASADNTLDPHENAFCTGSFISNTHVLSSEHCLADMGNSSFHIIAQSHIISHGTVYTPWWWSTYDHWAAAMNQLQAPDPYKDNDICIIKVLGFLPPNVPIAILSRINPQSLLFGLESELVGFGLLNNDTLATRLQSVTVTIISNDDCQERIRQILRRRIPVDERYICSIATPYGQIADGDSGGPLFFQGLVVGVSKGTAPRMQNRFYPNKANIHVGVLNYLEFIDLHLDNY